MDPNLPSSSNIQTGANEQPGYSVQNQPEVQVHGVLDDAVQLQLIRDSAANLHQLGVPVDSWTPQQVTGAGLTVSAFAKLSRVVTNITDLDQLDALYTGAMARNICGLPFFMNVLGFIGLCTFARTADGMKLVHQVQQMQKLAKRAVAGQSPQDAALSSILDIQLQEYATKQEQGRLKFNRELNELRKQLRLKELQMERWLNQLKEDHEPVSLFQKPTADQIGRRAWELYVQDAAAKGSIPHPENSKGLELAVKMFGAVARAEHAATFVAEEDKRESLLDYLRGRILECDTSGDVSQATRFRDLLAASGGEEVTSLSFASQKPTGSAHSSRSTFDEARAVDEEQDVGDASQPPITAGQMSSGRMGGTLSRRRFRDQGTSHGQRAQQLENRHCQKKYSGRRAQGAVCGEE